MTPIQGKTNNELLSLIAGFYIENEKKETKDKQEEKKVSSLVGGTIKKIGASGEELKSVGSGITSLVAGCLSFYKNEFFMIVDHTLLKAFNPKLLKHYMIVRSPDINPNKLYIFMASEVMNNVKYIEIHKLARQSSRLLYK